MVGVGAGFSRRLLGTALLVVMSACSHGGPGGSPPEPGGEPSPGSVSLPSPGVDQPRWKTPPAAYLAERNRCIDRELARRDLNEFGDAKGTTYAQGMPQGVTTTLDRYNHVLRHRPEIAVTCTRSPADAEP
jgi:hypothetical protein